SYEDQICAEVDAPSDKTHPVDIVNDIYARQMRTGGYYREAYHGRGLLSIMGLSWTQIIQELDGKDMPVAYARHLLAELEIRPITQAMVEGRHRDERDRLATKVWMARLLPNHHADDDGAEVSEHEHAKLFAHYHHADDDGAEVSEHEHAKLFAHYVERRRILMDLLRRAIQPNEPPVVWAASRAPPTRGGSWPTAHGHKAS